MEVAPSSEVGEQLRRFRETTLGTYSRPNIMFTHGEGLTMYAEAPAADGTSVEKRTYLDFTAGIAVTSLGHADSEIAAIAGEQAKELVHSSNLYYNRWSGVLAERLVALTRKNGGLGFAPGSPTPPEGQDLKTFLSNSGTESNEAALKFARKVALTRAGEGAKKTGLLCFKNGFHGRTMGALSVTPNEKYQAPFHPLIGNVHVNELNARDAIAAVDDSTAGVIVEPIQGEGGVRPASVDWLVALRKRCDEVGAMLIYDEIQCGLFRTGSMWCHSHMPVEAHPHMVTMAKPLANGFPIGAVLMQAHVADAIVVGDHGTTFGGGPLTSRIAHHVLGRMDADALRANIHRASEQVMDRLRRIEHLFSDLVVGGSTRGRGLLIGLSTKEPSHASKCVALARERGLLILSAGSDTLRFTPALIVSEEQVHKAMDILESSLVVLREHAS